jgi:hypothetical protein
VNVSYSQLAVHLSSLSKPFNDWSQRHVDQGFSWRAGSVSFRTLAEAGIHEVEIVVIERAIDLAEGAVRAIEVPFEVPDSGEIRIASIADEASVRVPSGKYSLRAEFIEQKGNHPYRVRLVFYRNPRATFRIVLADKTLSPDGDLLTTAVPAGN